MSKIKVSNKKITMSVSMMYDIVPESKNINQLPRKKKKALKKKLSRILKEILTEEANQIISKHA